jgi:hypothetical protein
MAESPLGVPVPLLLSRFSCLSLLSLLSANMDEVIEIRLKFDP